MLLFGAGRSSDETEETEEKETNVGRDGVAVAPPVVIRTGMSGLIYVEKSCETSFFYTTNEYPPMSNHRWSWPLVPA